MVDQRGRRIVSGILMGLSGSGLAPPPPPPPPPLTATIAWTGSSTTLHVTGASGTTSDHYHCDASGGAGGPYGFVLEVFSSDAGMDVADPTSGESHATWSGMSIGSGNAKSLNVRATVHDVAGNTAPTSNNVGLLFIRDS